RLSLVQPHRMRRRPHLWLGSAGDDLPNRITRYHSIMFRTRETTPVICFGQQPCGFFPNRFLYSKIASARRLQREMGGEIVFFFHDSDHDPRETTTVLRDQRTGDQRSFNFEFANKIQKQFSPLYAKRIVPEWQAKVARQLPSYVAPELVE